MENNSAQIIVLDFGSQYTQLIARRLREYGVYTEILPYFEKLENIQAKNPKGIILSGGPASVYEEGAYKPDSRIFELGIPVLGICYGMQYIADFFGGSVVKAEAQEFGKATLELNYPSKLPIRITDKLPDREALIQVWQDSVGKTHYFLTQDVIATLKSEVLMGLEQSRVWCAMSDGVPLGFIGVANQEITMLFVSPPFLHQGVGKKLVREAYRKSLKHFNTITLACNEQNKDAIAFYHNLGFEIERTSPTDKKGRPYPLCYMKVSSKVLERNLVLIHTERLTLNELCYDDFDELKSMLTNKEVMRAWEYNFCDEDVKEWLEKQQERYAQYGYGLWSVRDMQGKFIGQVGLSMQEIGCGQMGLEVGYILKREFWRQGFGFEAALACVQYAFDVLCQRQVYAIVKKGNEASAALARKLGMEVYREIVREFKGKSMPHTVYIKRNPKLEQTALLLFEGVKRDSIVWMSHADKVQSIPKGFVELARSGNTRYCAIADAKRNIYALQFHPEVAHSECGGQMLYNFATKICDSRGDWDMRHFAQAEIAKLKATAKGGKVLCAVSGGVDSSVVATLLHRAIGDSLIPVFVDTGLLRKGEREAVEAMFKENLGVPLISVDASEIFLGKLKGVSDPEKKRKIIGETFIEVFEAEAKKHNTHGEIKFLAQGTLYPDVIESVSVKGPSKTIKSHHNVGGLPEWMKFELIEPLRELFKDEVRALGRELGMPEFMLMRHPFPGPGLAIRIMGDVNEADLTLLKEADAIFISELRKAGLYDSVWQAFCVLLNVKSVGVMGDNRTYDNTLCLRAVSASDGMTATFSHLPHEFLESVATKIINEVEGINRVVYDITSKPPGTIEWE